MVQHAIDLQEKDGGCNVQRSFFSYMMFHVWSGGQRRAGTPIVTVANVKEIHTQINDLLEKLDIFLDSIRKESAGYEYLYEGESAAHLHFQYSMVTFPEPRDHKQWGNVLPIEKRSCFDIFTASDPNVPCVQQCAERIALKEHSLQDVRQCRTLDDLKTRLGERLCILNFHQSTRTINDIVDYTDLVLAKD
ncbi:hypothetical protein GGI20_005687, partial [Coemansia sp. BCRC 34301]